MSETDQPKKGNPYEGLRDRHFIDALQSAAENGLPEGTSAMLSEAADRLARHDRFQRLIGLLAPAGTAPRTALEQMYIQSATSDELSPIIVDLREMLMSHWGEWTPALREAEGLPPIQSDS